MEDSSRAGGHMAAETSARPNLSLIAPNESEPTRRFQLWESMPPRLHHALVLDYNADSAEFCPWRCCPDLLAVGTYQLDEQQGQRLGRLYLFSLEPRVPPTGHAAAPDLQPDPPASSSAVQPEWTLMPRQHVDLPGIFDLKWSPPLHGCQQQQEHAGLLGAALADGTLRMFALTPRAVQMADEESSLQLMQEHARCQACSEGMALSLDWQLSGSSSEATASDRDAGAREEHGCASESWTGRVAVSGSSGSLSIVQVCEAHCQVTEWHAHDLEVWCAAFSRCEPHILYSGADDSCFKAWDLRNTASAAFRDSRTHRAGVCTVSPHPHLPHVLATGSYDEEVRLWDVRQPCRPLVTAQVGTGGGNWRLRWHPTDHTLLLAACMYNGFAVLKAWPGATMPPGTADGLESQSHTACMTGVSDSVVCRLEVLQTYGGHGSIAYGADWHRQPPFSKCQRAEDGCVVGSAAAAGDVGAMHPSEGRDAGGGFSAQEAVDEGGSPGASCLIATCSFYDSLLNLWQL